MGTMSFDEAVSEIARWEKATTGAPLDGKLGIPVRWQSKYSIALRWVTNGSITVTERSGQQRSFTMKVERLSMQSTTRYEVTGMADCGREAMVLFDLKFKSDQNGAGFAAYWPTDLLDATDETLP